MQDVDPQNQDHSEVKNSDQLQINQHQQQQQQQQQQHMMATPKPNEICNNYILEYNSIILDTHSLTHILEPQESDNEYVKIEYQKQEEIYRGTFGT